MMKKNFWNKKKVLITGINGFVGGNICKELISLGANVTGLIRNKNKKTLLFLEKLNKNITLVDGSIDNKETLKTVIKTLQKDLGAVDTPVNVGVQHTYNAFTVHSAQ